MYLRRGSGPPQRPPVSHLAGDPLAIGDEYLADFQDDVEPRVFTDYREMIAEAPIDAVNDFTSHGLHHHVASSAFASGKHLLTQKPLASSVAAARRMCDEAEARDLVFGVFENFRTLPQTRHLGWLFESGRIGRAQMMLAGFVGAWWAPNRIVADTPWRHRKQEGGGITLDLGVHFLNQMRYVAGPPRSVLGHAALLEPRRVRVDSGGHVLETTTCDADDYCQASVTFESGAEASLLATWCGHGGATLLGHGLTYYGTKGRVAGDTVTTEGFPSEDRTLDSLYDAYATEERKRRDFPLALDDSFALAQWDWLEAVRERRPPEMSGREGLVDLAATFAILESSYLGRRVGVNEVSSGELREYQRHVGH